MRRIFFGGVYIIKDVLHTKKKKKNEYMEVSGDEGYSSE